MATFMMGNIVAPVIGPVVGAWMTESLSWRWCFFINIPAGICAFALLLLFLPGATRRKVRFDFLGFGSLAAAIASLQLMLDRGPSKDWLNSTEICIEAALTACAAWIFIVHTLTARRSLFDGRLARDRNFVSSTVLGFFLNLPLFAGVTLLPLLMQGLLGYSAMTSGLVSVPRGLCMMATLLIIGRLDAAVDRRVLVGAGLGLCLMGFWQMTGFSLQMSTSSIIWAGILQGVGQGIVYVPLSTLGFITLAPSLRPEGTALVSLARNLSSSLGLALMQALTVFNTQAVHAALAAHLTPGSLALHGLPALLHGSRAAASLNAEVTRQAAMVAYVDDFWLMVTSILICAPFLALLRAPQRAAVSSLSDSEKPLSIETGP
jgi:DHA2 family multidrug resistance protein